jgi:F-type H+-transporting ATPase subunit gamma
MAKTRAIIKRRKSVQNIRKITRTMHLVATVRFQSAMRRADRSAPYINEFTEVLDQLSTAQPIEHPLLEQHEASKRAALIVLTSNRGLCGAYNSAVIREAEAQIETFEQVDQQVELIVSGRKGISHFEYRGRELATGLTVFEHKPQFVEVEPIAVAVMDAYSRRHIDAMYVTYMHFESASRQNVQTIQLLPVETATFTGQNASHAAEPSASGRESIYETSPPAAELLGELLPQWVKLKLFQCFLHAAISEQVARMLAMKSASEAAGAMDRRLSQQYNRARQSQITHEMLDIMGGGESLA